MRFQWPNFQTRRRRTPNRIRLDPLEICTLILKNDDTEETETLVEIGTERSACLVGCWVLTGYLDNWLFLFAGRLEQYCRLQVDEVICSVLFLQIFAFSSQLNPANLFPFHPS